MTPNTMIAFFGQIGYSKVELRKMKRLELGRCAIILAKYRRCNKTMESKKTRISPVFYCAFVSKKVKR